MRNAVQLKIETPCTQNLQEMQPGELGKYCSQCEKEVIDFTNFSDAQLFNWFNKHQGSVCGSLNSTQAERFIQDPPLQKNNFWAARLALGAFIGLGFFNKLQAGSNSMFTQTAMYLSPGEPEMCKPLQIDSTDQRVKILITDSLTGQALKDVKVIIVGLKEDTAYYHTDDEGRIPLSLNLQIRLGSKIIVESFTNDTMNYYYHEFAAICDDTFLQNPHIRLKKNDDMVKWLGMISVYHYSKPRTFWRKITRPVRRLYYRLR